MKILVSLAHMNYLIANAVAIASCSLLNFLVSEEWIFDAEANSDQGELAVPPK